MASASQAMARWLTKPFGSPKLAAAICPDASSRAGVVSLMPSSPLLRPTNPVTISAPAVDPLLDRIFPGESVPRLAAGKGYAPAHIDQWGRNENGHLTVQRPINQAALRAPGCDQAQ